MKDASRNWSEEEDKKLNKKVEEEMMKNQDSQVEGREYFIRMSMWAKTNEYRDTTEDSSYDEQDLIPTVGDKISELLYMDWTLTRRRRNY